jgi:hypothetical protein
MHVALVPAFNGSHPWSPTSAHITALSSIPFSHLLSPAAPPLKRTSHTRPIASCHANPIAEHWKFDKVWVSLTTLPGRIDQTEPTILSLLHQTTPPDEIVISVPEQSSRERARYQQPFPWESGSGRLPTRCP